MSSGIKIRQFQWGDVEQFTRLFNEISDFTGSEKECDPAFMHQFLSQPNCDPEEHCFIAELDDRIAGFVLITHERPISRAVASGGVLQEYRNKGIGRRLLGEATEHARHLGDSVIHVQIPAQCNTAMHLLDSEGFRRVKCFWQMQWCHNTAPSPNLPIGFAVRHFRPGDDEEMLTELQNLSFGENWGFSPNAVEQIEARVQLGKGGPKGILFITDNGVPVAYNWTMLYSSDSRTSGMIFMTGVHPSYRRKGLGNAIVAAGIEHLKSQGADTVELEVDCDNAPARELYLKLGFRKIKETLWYEKQF